MDRCSEIKTEVAWRVGEDSEGHAVIVFHHHGLAARRIGAGQLGCDFEEVECRRASEFDEFSGLGRVPEIELVKRGWWVECSYCSHQISNDEYCYDRDIELPINGLIQEGHHLYCNEHCKKARQKEIDQCNEEFIEFQNKIKQMRPDLEFTDFQGEWPLYTKSAKFNFSGAKHGGGSVRQDKGEVTFWVANGDRDAWDRYEATRKKAKKDS